jgi:predicted HTH domain antitoxin
MAVSIPLDPELAAVLEGYDKPVTDAARELMVLELYRQGRISSGKAAELLNMQRLEFIQYSSRLGIPFLDMTDEEWQAEVDRSKKL